MLNDPQREEEKNPTSISKLFTKLDIDHDLMQFLPNRQLLEDSILRQVVASCGIPPSAIRRSAQIPRHTGSRFEGHLSFSTCAPSRHSITGFDPVEQPIYTCYTIKPRDNK